MLTDGSGIVGTAVPGRAARAALAATQPVRAPRAGGVAAGQKARIPVVTRSDEPYARRNDVFGIGRDDGPAPLSGGVPRAGGRAPRRAANPLLTSAEVAAELGLSMQTLAHWRVQGKGPEWIRVGEVHSGVRYPASGVEQWRDARTHSGPKAIGAVSASGKRHTASGPRRMSKVWIKDHWHLSQAGPDAKLCVEHSTRHKKLYSSGSHGKGGRWEVRSKEGRVGRFETAEKAEEAAVEARRERGEVTADPSHTQITLAEWADVYMAWRTCEERTMRNYRTYLNKHLIPALGERRIRDLRPADLQTWVVSCTIKPSYLRTIFQFLSTVLEAAVHDGRLLTNPCRSKLIDLPKIKGKRVEVWPDERVPAVIAALPSRYQIAGLIAAYANLRQGEVFGLAVEDIDFEREILHVRRQVVRSRGQLRYSLPKSGEPREFALHPQLARAFRAHMAQHPPVQVTLPGVDGLPHKHELVVTNTVGQPVQRRGFNIAWKRALAVAGVIPPRVRGKEHQAAREHGIHALRHWWASVMIELGVPIPVVAEAMGHHDSTVTLRTYAHVTKRAWTRKQADYDQEAAVLVDATYGLTGRAVRSARITETREEAA